MSRRLVVLLALFAFAQAPFPVSGQAPGSSAKGAQQPASAVQSPASNSGGPSAAENAGGTGEAQAPQIIVNPPPPAAAPWTWHDRVAWGAGMVLAVLGYAGIMLALRTLKTIERNSEIGAAAAQGALDASQALLAQNQLALEAQRPWIVVRVETSLTKENSFNLMASNRGRTPAKIVDLVDRARIAVDEPSLPDKPEYDDAKPVARREPVILLPGESMVLRAFSRDDVPAICKTDEELEKIKLWEKNIFIYGRVTYREMNSAADKKVYETDWCYWYIHGENKSALMIAGPREYNKHS